MQGRAGSPRSATVLGKAVLASSSPRPANERHCLAATAALTGGVAFETPTAHFPLQLKAALNRFLTTSSPSTRRNIHSQLRITTASDASRLPPSFCLFSGFDEEAFYSLWLARLGGSSLYTTLLLARIRLHRRCVEKLGDNTALVGSILVLCNGQYHLWACLRAPIRFAITDML